MKYRLYIILLFFTPLLFSYDSLYAATLFQQIGVSSSPNPVGSGARAVGMGGAFIAIVDDATAASWNPAGLIQLEKPELSLVGAYFHRREAFSSDINPEIKNTGKIDDLNINYLSATYPFQLFKRNMVVSINYQRLYDFERSYDYLFDYSPSRDLLEDRHFKQDGHVGALGLASAIQMTPKLSLGATLNIWTDKLMWRSGWEENYTMHGTGTLGGFPYTVDTQIIDKYSSFRGVNANFGLHWDISDHLTLGAVVKTPFNASLHHEYSYTQTEVSGPAATTTVTQTGVVEDIKLRMPLSYGIGMAWRVSDALSFALDVYRTDWSEYILTDGQGNKLSPIDGEFESDSNVKDTTQVRIGGEYLFIGDKMIVPIRGGLFYDPEPSHGTLKDFYGITVGSGVAYKKLIFDVAYQLRWGQDVDTGNLIATSTADIIQHLLLTSLIIHF